MLDREGGVGKEMVAIQQVDCRLVFAGKIDEKGISSIKTVNM